jgi:uncharacterized protein
VRRYTDRAFPPYRHLPGTTAHPERSPEGHMYRASEPPAQPLSSAGGDRNEDLLFGIDLFNAGYYWEAHTYWERLWAIEETSPEMRRFLQSIIQTAAACLKARQGRKAGARKLLEKAKLESFEGRVLGIDAKSLAREARDFVDGGDEPPRIALEPS